MTIDRKWHHRDTIAQVGKTIVSLCIIIFLLKLLSNPLTYSYFHLLLHNLHEVLKLDLYDFLFVYQWFEIATKARCEAA